MPTQGREGGTQCHMVGEMTHQRVGEILDPEVFHPSTEQETLIYTATNNFLNSVNRVPYYFSSKTPNCSVSLMQDVIDRNYSCQ